MQLFTCVGRIIHIIEAETVHVAGKILGGKVEYQILPAADCIVVAEYAAVSACCPGGPARCVKQLKIGIVALLLLDFQDNIFFRATYFSKQPVFSDQYVFQINTLQEAAASPSGSLLVCCGFI